MTEGKIVIGLFISTSGGAFANFEQFNMTMNIKENIARSEISAQYDEFELIDSKLNVRENKFEYTYKVNEESRKIY